MFHFLEHNIGKYFVTIRKIYHIYIFGHIHTTCKTKTILLISHLLTFAEDRSQLCPLKTIGNKTIAMDSLFDLSISE